MYRFKNFSESGNKVIVAASSIAGRMGHITVGTEHLLMGILSCGKTDAADLLAEYGVSFVCIYNVVSNILGTGTATTVGGDDMSANAVTALKSAHSVAIKNSRRQAGASEILLAILSVENCMGVQIMKTMVKQYERFYTKAEKLCSSSGISQIAAERSRLKTLEKYSENLTARARIRPFDPCTGREKELVKVTEILLRRQKNNPCLTGYAGVGKTAIIEGLANHIAAGNVPPQMRNKKIYSLDIAGLIAGTKYRGDFEERIKSVIEEASGDRDIILFIDEMHIIAGAGGAEGAIDAANLLKPALARGQLQIIGATTQEEYTRIIEKDSALERRFSVVEVLEPSAEQTKEILHGIKGRYMEFHGVEITDDAIDRCVDLSLKYIHYRYLPDKAIDILDQSCAAVKMTGEAVVDGKTISRTVSLNTGIPVEKIIKSEKEKYMEMERRLKERITGQSFATAEIARCLKRWRAGLKGENSPIASFMFAGPTGVGKTYSCSVLAQLMFERPDSVVRIDCTEHSEKNDVTKLIGSPPGYVGYDEGGRLEKEMGRTPHCLVLFDEIEKAHPDLHNLLLQAMDTGFITTARGKKISFRNSIIAMTSNVGADIFTAGEKIIGFAEKTENRPATEKLKTELKKYFSREFIGRIDCIVPFVPLDRESIKDIAVKELDVLVEKLKKQNIVLEYDTEIVNHICSTNSASEFGARNIRRIISQEIETPVVDMILQGELTEGAAAILTADDKPRIKILQEV